MRKSISRTVAVELTAGIAEQKIIIMPADMDIYRAHFYVYGFIPQNPLDAVIISSQVISSQYDSFAIPAVIGQNFTPLIMDRRGTDSYMVDNLNVALFLSFSIEDPVFLHILYEGFAK